MSQQVTQTNVIKSEWIKFRSLRSTLYTTMSALVLMIGLGLLFSFGEENRWSHAPLGDRLNFDPGQVSLRGLFLAQLAVGVLGVLMFSGEYATGMIRATFSAVPKRLPVLWAKLTVYGIAALITMTIAAFVAFLGGQAILHTQHIGTSLAAASVLRQVIGASLFLFGVALLGVALGAILRSTAGAIATLFGILFVLPILAAFLPTGWDRFNKYLPSTAGQAAVSLHHGSDSLGAWSGLGLFGLYVLIAVVIAALTLRRRDA